MSHIVRIEESLRVVLSEQDEHVSIHQGPHAFASEAGQCLRKVGFRLVGPERPDQSGFSTQTLLAFRVGKIIHQSVEQAILRSKLRAQVEVSWEHGLVTGRADATYETESGVKIVVEIKTMNPVSFSRAVADGAPTRENNLQAALSAVALHASHQHLIYINKAAKQGDDPVAEWIYPTDARGARSEFDRLEQAVKLTQAGFLPPREYAGIEIDDPNAQSWPCRFCEYREKCIQAGPGVVPLP